MQILGINHLGLAAKDPEKARHFLRDILRLPFVGDELVLEQKTQTIMFDASHRTEAISPSRLEILAPQAGTQDSPIQKFLDTKGGGIHHLALTVQNLDQALQELLEQGVELIDKTPRKGAHHTRIAFIHPKATGGILIELVEAAESSS